MPSIYYVSIVHDWKSRMAINRKWLNLTGNVSLHVEQRKTNKEIGKSLNRNESTIHSVIKRYNSGDNTVNQLLQMQRKKLTAWDEKSVLWEVKKMFLYLEFNKKLYAQIISHKCIITYITVFHLHLRETIMPKYYMWLQ